MQGNQQAARGRFAAAEHQVGRVGGKSREVSGGEGRGGPEGEKCFSMTEDYTGSMGRRKVISLRWQV